MDTKIVLALLVAGFFQTASAWLTSGSGGFKTLEKRSLDDKSRMLLALITGHARDVDCDVTLKHVSQELEALNELELNSVQSTRNLLTMLAYPLGDQREAFLNEVLDIAVDILLKTGKVDEESTDSFVSLLSEDTDDDSELPSTDDSKEHVKSQFRRLDKLAYIQYALTTALTKVLVTRLQPNMPQDDTDDTVTTTEETHLDEVDNTETSIVSSTTTTTLPQTTTEESGLEMNGNTGQVTESTGQNVETDTDINKRLEVLELELLKEIERKRNNNKLTKMD